MNTRSSHAAKSRGERISYQRYITKIDPQPTTITKLVDFDESSDNREEFSTSKLKHPRQIPLNTRLLQFIKQHYIEWGLAVILFIALFLVIDAKKDIAIININISNTQQQIERLFFVSDNYNTLYQEQQDKIYDINIDINDINNSIDKLDLKLEYIEKESKP